MSYCKDSVEEHSKVLNNEEAPLKERFRALFSLRLIKDDESVREISKAFTTSSVLLKHELAYVLGQMQVESALPVLADILENSKENEIVRHEAAEAIATFGDKKYGSLLEKYSSVEVSNSVAVSETCEIGASLIASGGAEESMFGTLDPAPASSEEKIEELRRKYLDTSTSLYGRYAAMFKLRDICTQESVDVLGKGFFCENRSDLFEHEIAFVFGQMCHPGAVKYLEQVLEDEKRHEMVRHEAAEALGNIGTKEAVEILNRHRNSPSRIVRESVEVGLDMTDSRDE